MSQSYWLMKSEPDAYCLDDLARDKKTHWDGVRNYQARNFIRDAMKPGDGVLFYHSNAEPPGIAGLAEVTSEGYPDPSAFDPRDIHHDPASKKENPTWYCVDIRFVKKFPRLLSLESLRKIHGLEGMPLLQKGQRLSIQPVTRGQWDIIIQLPG